MSEKPQNMQETGRNPDGTFKEGFSGNPGGRPKNSLKDYIKIKLSEMTDEEKEKWIQEHKISGIDQWKMSEGNPHNTEDVTSGGEKINPILVKFLDGNNNRDTK